MERFLVAFMAVALLLSGAKHSRADYRSVYESVDSGNGARFFWNPPGVAIGLIGDILLADALTHPARVFLVTSLGSLTSGERQFFEPGGTSPAPFRTVPPGDSLPVRPPRFESDAAFLVESGCLCLGGGHFGDALGLERDGSKEILVAVTFGQGADMLRGDDLFLTKFGGAGTETGPSEPPRAAPDFSRSGSVTALLFDHKVLSGLSLFGLVALSILAYAVRQRRVVPHRGLRGPRRTAIYGSSTPSNPGGTRR